MMSKRSISVIVSLSFLALGTISAQDFSEKELAVITAKYFGSKDLYRGVLYKDQGQAQKARQLLLRASEDFEAQENWEGYITAIHTMVHSFIGDPDYETGLTIGKTAIDIIAQQAPTYRYSCGRIYYSMGAIYNFNVELELAMAAFRKELELLNKKYEEDSNYQFARSYNCIGVMYRNMSKFKEAEVYFNKSLNLLQNLPDLDQHQNLLARTYEHLGHFYTIKGNIEKALEISQAGLNIAKKIHGEHSLQLVHYYQNIGSLYTQIEEHASAIGYYKKVLYIIQKSKTTDAIYYLEYLPNLYEILHHSYLQLNDKVAAAEYFQLMLQYLNDSQGNHREEARMAMCIGQYYLFQDATGEAEKYLAQSDSLLKLFKDKTDIDLLNTKSGLKFSQAALADAMGQTEKVIVYLNEGTKLLMEGEPEPSPNLVDGYHQLASIYLKKGQIDSALFYNQKALMASCYTYGSDDFSSLPPLSDFRDYTVVYKVLKQRLDYIRKIITSEKSRRKKDFWFKRGFALAHLMDELHSHNLEKINLLRSTQSRTLIASSIEPYHVSIDLAYEHFQWSGAPSSLEQAFYFAQKMKAQQLWLTLLDGEAVHYEEIAPSLLEQERDLIADINYYEKLVVEARKQGDKASLELYENEYLFSKYRTYQRLMKQMERRYPDYFASKYNFQPEAPRQLNELLVANELLVEYVLMDSTIYLFSMSKNQPLTLQKIPFSQESKERISIYQELLSNSIMNRPQKKAEFTSLSYALYQQFIAPIEAQLIGHHRLIIIGDGLTNYIPFETLIRDKEEKSFKDLDYLIWDHEINYHYSASLFAKSRKKIRETSHGVYAFAPVYDQNSPVVAAQNVNNYTAMAGRFRAVDENGCLSPLPASEKEVKTIVAAFEAQDKHANNHISIRETATEANLKEHLIRPYQYIHIAAHSFANIDNPKFSGIACFEEQREVDSNQEEDQTLYTGEIYNLNITADLITLSSCESGYGKLEKTEGLLGLNRAFIHAGTPNVVFSLWKVYDKVSAQLMIDFYRNILAGESYAASLRAAKLTLLRADMTATPHFWSPYLLIGR